MIRKCFIFLILFCLCGCNRLETTDLNNLYEANRSLFGVNVTIQAYSETDGEILEWALNRGQAIENAMSVNQPESDISRINQQAGGGEMVPIFTPTAYVISEALRYAEQSEGLFDVTIGRLVSSWGIGTDNPRIPTESEINEGIKLTDYHDLIVSLQDSTAQLKKKGQMVDINRIAKGFAGDQIKDVLVSEGSKGGIVKMGEDYVVYGKMNESMWTIEIMDPLMPNTSLGCLNITDRAISTVGDYQEYFTLNGQKYHHILHPKTGYPIQTDIASVSIIANTSMQAHAISTIAIMMGLEKGLTYIEQLPEVEGIFITRDKKIIATKGIQDVFVQKLNSGYTMIEK